MFIPLCVCLALRLTVKKETLAWHYIASARPWWLYFAAWKNFWKHCQQCTDPVMERIQNMLKIILVSLFILALIHFKPFWSYYCWNCPSHFVNFTDNLVSLICNWFKILSCILVFVFTFGIFWVWSSIFKYLCYAQVIFVIMVVSIK